MEPEASIHLEGRFFFDPADPIYQDHFPGKPVVPGSLILHAFLEALRQHGMPRPKAAEKFRFIRFVAPGSYPYRIHGSTEVLRCELSDGSQPLATGILKACS